MKDTISYVIINIYKIIKIYCYFLQKAYTKTMYKDIAENILHLYMYKRTYTSVIYFFQHRNIETSYCIVSSNFCRILISSGSNGLNGFSTKASVNFSMFLRFNNKLSILQQAIIIARLI